MLKDYHIFNVDETRPRYGWTKTLAFESLLLLLIALDITKTNTIVYEGMHYHPRSKTHS